MLCLHYAAGVAHGLVGVAHGYVGVAHGLIHHRTLITFHVICQELNMFNELLVSRIVIIFGFAGEWSTLHVRGSFVILWRMRPRAARLLRSLGIILRKHRLLCLFDI